MPIFKCGQFSFVLNTKIISGEVNIHIYIHTWIPCKDRKSVQVRNPWDHIHILQHLPWCTKQESTILQRKGYSYIYVHIVEDCFIYLVTVFPIHTVTRRGISTNNRVECNSFEIELVSSTEFNLWRRYHVQ